MKAKITVVDLIDHTLEEFVSEGTNPVDCYVNTMEDLEGEDLQLEVDLLTSLIKQKDGKWVIDREDGLIFIQEITE